MKPPESAKMDPETPNTARVVRRRSTFDRVGPSPSALGSVPGDESGSPSDNIGVPTSMEVQEDKALQKLDVEDRPLFVEHAEGHKECILNPYGSMRISFDVVLLMCVIFVAIMTPMKICFDWPIDNLGWFIFDRLIDLVFILDVVLNFFTAHEENAVLIFDRYRNSMNYLNTWFAVDFISSVPLELIAFWIEGNDLSLLSLPRLLRIIKLIKLVRLLRLLKLMRIFNRLEESFIWRYSVMTILKFLFLSLMWCHWASCLFFMMARENMLGDDLSFDQNSWVANAPGVGGDAGRGVWYLASFYFALSTITTIGYGDIHPYTDRERGVTLALMIMGTCLFAYGITNIIDIYSGLNEKEDIFRQKMDQINVYITEKRLPKKLRHRIREYFLFMKRHNLGLQEFNQERAVLNELSTPLRTQVTNFINRDILKNIPFLKDSHPYFSAAFIELLEPRFFSPGEEVIKEGSFGTSMYILNKGCVDVVVKGTPIARLEDGSVFGEIALLGIANKRTATILTVTCCDMRVVSRAAFLKLLSHHPQERRKFELEAKRKLADLKDKEAETKKEKQVKEVNPDAPAIPSSLTIDKDMRALVSPLSEDEEKQKDSWLQNALVNLPRLSGSELSSLQLRISAQMLQRMTGQIEDW
uniref:Cyclic nucleotide-binding domain-containing protein n=1 Tax=Chromera velia CCMP2878 TaxID=1169474 RepID=A0A0G4G5H8_9ALVE|eukprot:Cvel_573.t1-p1 / transcript=Cvel_573.t1 / gene=Cvel_573 / organism=Chromera_velia_CCMP2878 / gene_product=Potassium/sodium hyperpolarization-activated cyclic, putative / transcript_product=Potassium/sodium hyperpolarization-activated cyclic, putative / location=Cvel_scaffold17:205951-215766(+) / protein_length=640 / sequence_SO=supercontig / SO=protein_coding / is_pseudo=false